MSSSEDSPNASAIPSSEMVDISNTERYKLLYEACVKGNCDSVKRFAEDNRDDPNLWTTWIDTYICKNTALCVAALSGQTKLIRNLVELMPEEALLATNSDHYTALHYIAKIGDVETAKILVTKNPLLTQIPNKCYETPLLVAAGLGCKEMVRYLVTVTKDETSDRWPYKCMACPYPFRGKQGAALLVSVINFDLYDVALDLVQKYKGIAKAKNREGMSAVSALAKKSSPDSAMSRGQWNVCNKFSGLHFVFGVPEGGFTNSRRMREKYLELIDYICCTRHKYSELLHNVIEYKQKEIFHYLKHPKFKNELSTMKISNEVDTILHLAANISPSRVLKKIPGAVLQVQHDVKWYKEVAAMVPFYENTRNREGLTPEDIFYDKHQDLIQKGEKWMQNTASSSMVVATLIATVVFAAAFTVPGGNRSDVGLPFFLNKMPYLVFAVSNAMALCFSLTSVLIFLSILTSNYDIEDFMVSLPRRLIIGEAMLFFAIATMAMAFGATYFIMLGHKLAWLSILIAFFICLPVILFVILQARLFYVIFKSTYTSSLL